MDRTRLITTLEYYARQGPIAARLREDARAVLQQLEADPRFDGAVTFVTRTFVSESVGNTPRLAPQAELIAKAFKAGLHVGVSIGAVGEGRWE